MPLEGVTLKLTNSSPDQQPLSALSDAEGRYEFLQLSPDTYRIEVQLEGFEPFVKAFPLHAGEMHVENVVLHIPTVVEQVEVKAKATSVSTQSTVSTTELEERQFQALPLAEQKFQAVLPLVPGVTRTHDGTLNMKGEVENQGMLVVDSARTVDPVTGTPYYTW
jgi:hypothetical protein